jgi:catechol 2,3-dioxygenase-like lactoylglutathione lyase family enzyme
MARGLDHIVHGVRDLDAAAELYRRLGFTVGARNRHPWGTHNHIVQMPGFFVELLAVVEADKIIEAAPGRFSFGAYMRDWLARREGLAMLVLESADAAGDREAFVNAGIGDFELLRFEREGRRPDGAAVKLAFSLAFATDQASPDAGFFVCQQHYPENFWNPAFQTHANGVTQAAGVVLAAERPDDHRAFVAAFSGAPGDPVPGGLRFVTPRGTIEVVEPAEFARRFGDAPPPARGTFLAAIDFAVGDLDRTRRCLEANGVAVERRAGRLVVGPRTAIGATLAFVSG